jgi:DNA-binding response OmpR family regulator
VARIIIADDDEIVGQIACDALKSGGHVAGIVADGGEALKVIRAKRPDLVVLDCNMPGMNGLLVLRELRNSMEFRELPVLVLTGRTSDRDAELVRFEGADDYMKKPFDPEELLFRVDELLAARKKTTPDVRPTPATGFGKFRPR